MSKGFEKKRNTPGLVEIFHLLTQDFLSVTDEVHDMLQN